LLISALAPKQLVEARCPGDDASCLSVQFISAIACVHPDKGVGRFRRVKNLLISVMWFSESSAKIALFFRSFRCC